MSLETLVDLQLPTQHYIPEDKKKNSVASSTSELY
jgi:hypothetical protein